MTVTRDDLTLPYTLDPTNPFTSDVKQAGVFTDGAGNVLYDIANATDRNYTSLVWQDGGVTRASRQEVFWTPNSTTSGFVKGFTLFVDLILYSNLTGQLVREYVDSSLQFSVTGNGSETRLNLEYANQQFNVTIPLNTEKLFVNFDAAAKSLRVWSNGSILQTVDVSAFNDSTPFRGNLRVSAMPQAALLGLYYITENRTHTEVDSLAGDPYSIFEYSAGGTVTVTGETATYNYNGVTASVDLAGSILVTGQVANYNYSSIDGVIELTPEITVSGQTGNYDYTATNANVTLTGAIDVVGETANYNYSPIQGQVQLSGEILVTAETANYNYLGSIATVKVFDVWSVKTPVSTNWQEQDNISTDWQAKAKTNTNWSIK